MTGTVPSASARLVRRVAPAIGVLVAIVLVFAAFRVAVDWPNILLGTTPQDEFAVRYVEHPWLAYLHIAPGVGYLVGAPLQLTPAVSRPAP